MPMGQGCAVISPSSDQLTDLYTWPWSAPSWPCTSWRPACDPPWAGGSHDPPDSRPLPAQPAGPSRAQKGTATACPSTPARSACWKGPGAKYRTCHECYAECSIIVHRLKWKGVKLGLFQYKLPTGRSLPLGPCDGRSGQDRCSVGTVALFQRLSWTPTSSYRHTLTSLHPAGTSQTPGQVQEGWLDCQTPDHVQEN